GGAGAGGVPERHGHHRRNNRQRCRNASSDPGDGCINFHCRPAGPCRSTFGHSWPRRSKGCKLSVSPPDFSKADAATASTVIEAMPLADLLAASQAMTVESFGPLVTYSRKVFIPLTRLC